MILKNQHKNVIFVLPDALQVFFKDPNPQTHVILIATKVDKRTGFYKAYKKVGEVIEVDGIIGKVEEINLRNSQILTRDNVVVIVPNSKFVSEKVVNWSIIFLALACLIAVLSPELPGLFELIFGGNAIPQWFNSKSVFWIAAIFIGLFSGPNQSSSRSLMARITPEKNRNEFFGFYALRLAPSS